MNLFEERNPKFDVERMLLQPHFSKVLRDKVKAATIILEQ
jgi:hypothetical protein